MVRKIIRTRLPKEKPIIEIGDKNILSKDKYCIINYAQEIRKIKDKPMWLGRDWASLRAYQMFCHFDPSKCSYTKNNICGYNRGNVCGLAWQSRDISIRKSAQSRWSEFFVTLACYLVDVWGWDVGYYMPTEALLKKWGHQRIKEGCIKTNERFSKICKPTNEYILFNECSYLYLLGLHNESTSYALQCYFIDEVAQVENLDNLVSPKSRVMDNPINQRLAVRFSTPKRPGRDINSYYDEGNQLRWHIECDNCGSLEKISYLTHIDKDSTCLRCLNCRSKLNRMSDGKYIPDKPENRNISLQYEYTYCDPDSTNEEKERDNLDSLLSEMIELDSSERLSERIAFYNHRLGRSYTPPGTEITEDMIKNCPRYNTNKVNFSDNIIRTAGVDVGNTVFDIRVSDRIDGARKRLVYAGTFPYPESNKKHGKITWEKLGNLLFNILKCDLVVVDNLPNRKEAMEFALAYPGKVYRCVFDNGKVESIWHAMEDNNSNNWFKVNVDRTTAIDNIQNEISSNLIEYPENFFTLNNVQVYGMTLDCNRYIKHMGSVYKVNVPLERKENGTLMSTENIYKWVTKPGEADHQCLAEVYDSLCGLMGLNDIKVHIVKHKEKKKNFNKIIEEYDYIQKKFISEDVICGQ